MYEPIRSKSVHSIAGARADFPHRSREEELDIQLAGHLAALLAVTDELRALAPDAGLDTAAERLAAQVARLRGGALPARAVAVPAPGPVDRARSAALHRRAHALAGRALVVAASRADTAAAILSAECMDAHAAAAGEPRVPAPLQVSAG
ncbi:hypothetical protein GCM10018793_25570 [Streptomyces sulfonofaciens]|uniref:Uncharacterized protein n=1 Tax=Streptomyces sulfonofaciens TaxID=68272 RepID=A0A919KY07_9ACTN|nr:hypothetical protein [Streptomyces sulfonofaciens]GHH77455.1 hypothetical protein GCM10018793_25570 [Streptomyces sulfonofaciens]